MVRTLVSSLALALVITACGGGGSDVPPGPRPLDLTFGGAGTGHVTSDPAGIDCTASCSASFDRGTTVTLTAVADEPWAFGGWSGACTGTGSCVVTIDQARSVSAAFVLGYLLTVYTSPGGALTSDPAGIDCAYNCSSRFAAGTEVTLTAHGTNGGVFFGWFNGCTGTSPTCTIAMDQDKTVTAAFSYWLTVTKDGTGGGTVASTGNFHNIDCGPTCETTTTPGTTMTLAATPDAESVFTGWSGDCSGTGDCVVQFSKALAVTATFTRQ